MSNLLEQASLVLIPSGYKEDVVYSQIPTSGAGDLSFTRASNGTRINSAGLVEVCPWNLLEQSQSFSTSGGAWNFTAGSGVTTGQTGYDGTTNAVLFTDSGANAVYGAYQSFSQLGAVTLSIYAKAGSTNIFNIDIFQTPLATVRVNLSTGAITSGSGTVESVGNGWYRISVTAVMTDTYYVRFGCPATGTVYIQNIQANIGATAKPYFPTTDRLNVPRLTYQNGGGGCPSLLLEPQRTNIFPNSQTTANWSFTNMSRTANYGISPDGTQNADLLFPTTSGAVAFNSDNTTSSLVIGQPFVVSFFIKLNASFISNAGTNILDIRLAGAAVWSRPTVRINLETGEVTAVNNASYISSTNFGNGWFRITFGATPTGTSAAISLQAPTGVTMNGGSFYIWGLQGEANATYATSYIPSQASSATRVADECAKSGIGSLIGQSEGSIFLEMYFTQISNAQFRAFFCLEGSVSSQFSAFVVSTTNNGNDINYAGTNYSLTTGRHKVICTYSQANNQRKLFVDGVLRATSTHTNFLSSIDRVSVGCRVNPFSGFSADRQLSSDSVVSEFAVFNSLLTDAECQSLTTL